MNLTKLLEGLGKANKPVYAVVSVALFKGIFRPTFTMMDKKSDPETKKYAAVREGATELTALVTYPLLSWATEKLAPAFTPRGKNYGDLIKNSKSTLGFFGVCFAALFAIPKICNIIMPSVMKSLGMVKPDKKNEAKIDAVSLEKWDAVQAPLQDNNKVQSYAYAKPALNHNGGMRV